MVRTIITPEQAVKEPKKNLGDFFGVLSKEEYHCLKEQTQQARKEWDRIF